MNNSLRQIKDEELTYYLDKWGQERARAKRKLTALKNQKRAVLAEIKKWFPDRSNIAAEDEARVTPEYQEFCKKLSDAEYEYDLAYNKVDTLRDEIKLRLNKSFQDRAEYQGGRLQT